MNAVVASGMAAMHASDAACFHCGEALPASPARVVLDGAPRLFCCDGCAGKWAKASDADKAKMYAKCIAK